VHWLHWTHFSLKYRAALKFIACCAAGADKGLMRTYSDATGSPLPSRMSAAIRNVRATIGRLKGLVLALRRGCRSLGTAALGR
jgi:hypothetical protein